LTADRGGCRYGKDEVEIEDSSQDEIIAYKGARMKKPFALLALGLCAFLSAPAQASVGNIYVCYNCSGPAGNNFGFGVQDGPIFEINNTSGSAITNAVLTANGDPFAIGTIVAGGSFFIEPGITNDGNSGHTFFSVTGSGILDTSDSGPNSDTTPFSFTGMLGLVPLSVTFTPGDTHGPSLDGTIPQINFLGGGPNSDGACNNCFYGQVATLSTPTSVTPEPSSVLLFGTGLLALGFALKKAVV
jgi:PEP-CTERM motif